MPILQKNLIALEMVSVLTLFVIRNESNKNVHCVPLSLSHLHPHVCALIKIVPLVLACSNFSCKNSGFQLFTYVLGHQFFTPVFLWLTSQLHFLPPCPTHWNIPFKTKLMCILKCESSSWLPPCLSRGSLLSPVLSSLHPLNNKEMFPTALLANMSDPNSPLWWSFMVPSFVEGSHLPPVVEAEEQILPVSSFDS